MRGRGAAWVATTWPLLLLASACSKPVDLSAEFAPASLSSEIPDDYAIACNAALKKTQSAAQGLSGAAVPANSDLTLLEQPPNPRFTCPLVNGAAKGRLDFELDCSDPTDAACITPVDAALDGKGVYMNDQLMEKQLRSGLQMLGLVPQSSGSR